jgi:glycine/D-amino acid oxidase-like deaminating enzyme
VTPITDQSPIQYDADLPASADIVIIGAGIIGITTAWFLARQGLRIVVCEKGRVAGEQSSRNWGWIRQQGRDEAELPIMMDSMRIWENLPRDIGADIGFRREGSFYLCENESEIPRYDHFLSFAPNYGLHSELISSDKLYSLISNTPRHWVAALHTPSDGRAEPSTAVPAMARACVRAGVTIIENCAVRTVSATNRVIDGVYTERGLIKCSTVVCCGGAWTSSLLYNCGLNLPQLAVKASVVSTAGAPLILAGNASDNKLAIRRREDGGYTIAMTDYLEFFPTLHGLGQAKKFLPLFGTAYKKLNIRLAGSSQEKFHPRGSWHASGISPFEQNRVLNPLPTQKALDRLRWLVNTRLPVLKDVAITQSWAGMIDATPDAVPVMDAAPGLEGLYIASGFSGHGFGIGPACGKIMADMVQNNNIEYDLSRFRFSRFSDGSRLKPGPSI